MIFYKDKLRVIRKKQNYKINELASAAGISRYTLSAWENGQRVPSEKKIRLLANILNISVENISDLQEDKIIQKKDYSEIADAWMSLVSSELNTEEAIINSIFPAVSRLLKQLKLVKIIENVLMTSIQEVIYIKDVDQKYIMANRAFLKNISLNANFNVLGKVDKDFFSTSEAARNFAEDESVMHNDKPIINLEGFIPGTRKSKWGIIMKIPIKNNEGGIIGLAGTFIDITDRKKNEKIRELLEIQVNLMQEGLGIFDLEKKRYIYLNDAREKIFGRPNELFYQEGRNFWLNHCVHPDDRGRLVEIVDNENYNYRIIKPDGEIRWIKNSTYSEIMYCNRRCSLVTNQDITDEIKVSKSKDLFAFIVSQAHEFVCIANLNNKSIEYISDNSNDFFGQNNNFKRSNIHNFLKNCIHVDSIETLESIINSKKESFIGRISINHSENNNVLVNAKIFKKRFYEEIFLIIIIDSF